MENSYSFIVEVMANGKYIPAPLYELKELDMYMVENVKI